MRRSAFSKNRYKGFTLMEIVVVGVISAVMLTIGAMMFSRHLKKNDFNQSVYQVQALVKQAQSEAKAYGTVPSGYTSGSDASDFTGDVRITIYKDGQIVNSTVIKNITTHVNFTGAFPGNLSTVKGVGIGMAYKDPTSNTYTNAKYMALGQNGAPYLSISSNNAGDTEGKAGYLYTRFRYYEGSTCKKTSIIYVERFTGDVQYSERNSI